MRRFKQIGLVSFLSLMISSVPALSADDALVAAAKKEGHVTWYTSLIIDQFVRPAAAAFEKKYGIKADFVRGDAAELALRLYNEARTGHPQADIFDGTSAVVPLKKQNMVMNWLPDDSKHLPADFRDPAGYWVAANLYVYAPGYNTNLVPKDSVPRNFQDLLDPRWKGKMAWGSSNQASAAPGFIGLVLDLMGEQKGLEYLQALAKQQVAPLGVSARQVLDQVIAGEYSIALQIFDNHAVISAAQGAPVDWIRMNPVMNTPSVFSIMKDAPHPNAAKLLEDFMVSSDGQKLLRDADYIPVDPAVPPRDASLRPDGETLKGVFYTPEQIDEKLPKWFELFGRLFH
jgi:iron(III) transport system substrate-binding protein